jgi:hypothetical protein
MTGVGPNMSLQRTAIRGIAAAELRSFGNPMRRYWQFPRAIVVAVLVGGVLSCATARSGKPSSSGASSPPGLSCETAVVIDAASESEGIAAERRWLAKNYPNGRLLEQSLSNCGKRAVDMITVRSAEGTVVRVYFDITSFLGKM